VTVAFFARCTNILTYFPTVTECTSLRRLS